MEEKKCFKCFEVKPLSDFYKHAQMGDGHLNKCKICTKKDATKTRNGNIEYYREYDRGRSMLPHRVALRKAVHEADKNKEDYSKRSYERTKRHREKYPKKYKAKMSVQNAIRAGKLKKESCRVCGNIKSEAHHEDYNFPLNIVWVCRKHHMEIHKNNGSLRKKD